VVTVRLTAAPDKEDPMTDLDLADDPRCGRPAELDRLLIDLRKVLVAVEACHEWRPWLDDWRDRLADAVTVDGNIDPDANDEAERLSGMNDVQEVAFDICTALEATFGFASLDFPDYTHPIYPEHHRVRNDADT
jgi:hypothetical protein